MFYKRAVPSLKTDELKSNIEHQWKTNKVLTTLTQEFQEIAILRREDEALVLYKQRSTEVKGELLGVLKLILEAGEISVAGTPIK